MGRIEKARLAYRSGVHRRNSTLPRANVSLGYRIADWGVTLVRGAYSQRLPSASWHWQALAQMVGLESKLV